MLEIKSPSFFYSCLVLLLFFSCDDKQVFDAYTSTQGQWHKDSIVTFNFKAPDTINPYNLFINIRNTNDYPFSNLFLITELIHPNGKIIKDTLEYKMAAPNGELLGTGLSNLKENKLWYKGHENDFVFKEEGAYDLRIQQAMRENGSVEGLLYLEGVNDVGFRIEQRD
jgi:gliding motility-associated lipoprotein GldH